MQCVENFKSNSSAYLNDRLFPNSRLFKSFFWIAEYAFTNRKNGVFPEKFGSSTISLHERKPMQY